MHVKAACCGIFKYLKFSHFNWWFISSFRFNDFIHYTAWNHISHVRFIFLRIFEKVTERKWRDAKIALRLYVDVHVHISVKIPDYIIYSFGWSKISFGQFRKRDKKHTIVHDSCDLVIRRSGRRTTGRSFLKDGKRRRESTVSVFYGGIKLP